MTIAPNRTPETPTSEDASNFLNRMLHYERPSTTANSSSGSHMVELARRNEALSGARVEQTGLWGNITNLFLTRTETRSELNSHGVEVGADLSRVSSNVSDLAAVWNDDPELRRKIDQYERYNEKYGGRAQYVIDAEMEQQRLSEGGKSEVLMGVIDENSTPEEIAEIEAQQEKNRLRAAANEEWNRLAVRGPNGRWRKRTISSVLKSHFSAWREGEVSFWKMIKNGFRDAFVELPALGKALPVVNLASYGARQFEEKVEPYRKTVETAGELGGMALDGRRTQKEIQREGAETVVILSESVKDGLAKVARGEITREAFVTNYQRGLNRLREQSPNEFAQMLKRSGVRARSLNTRAGLYEFMRRTSFWFLHPSERVKDNIFQELETIAPIWGSVAAWRDINEENGLPAWMRYGFATVGTGLDALTVYSLGLLTPITVGGKTLLRKGSVALARLGVRRATKELLKTGARVSATQQARALLGGMSSAARKALSVRGAGKFLMGAAAYSGLSYTMDWVFSEGIDHVIENYAFNKAEEELSTEFTRQQRRLLRIVGSEVADLARDVYADYREDAAEEDQAEVTVAANDNRAPIESGTLDAGQTADVLTPEEEKLAA